ncbi:MAG: AAA family ATPase [Leptospira sp.]|nr:AAA family ATPase [Leptospira sp.]
MQITEELLNEISGKISSLKSELAHSITGMGNVIDPVLIAILTKGHVLLEGMPGLAKTLLAKSLANAVDVDFSRVQFTPDLLPADLTGTNIFNPKTTNFEIRKGPVFTNILLADEINRAPAKVQSALLQSMEERQVTISDQTFELGWPFFVIATQNPIDQEGTYPLPEAQLDRFLFKVSVTYPTESEELNILKQHGTILNKKNITKKVIQTKDLQRISEAIQYVYVEPKLEEYIIKLIRNSRPESTSDSQLKNFIRHGVSPRGSLALLRIAKAEALLSKRNFIIPEDIQKYFYEVLNHRIHLSFDAIAEDISVKSISSRILEVTDVP